MDKQYKVQVKDLHKSYGENEVLKGIDLAIKPSEVVCMIGPSGSGKSTFLRCLNRLEVPNSGHIYIDGYDIADPKTDINLVRQNIGMVFQHFNLFPNMSVIDNITLAPVELKKMSKEEAHEAALHYLDIVGLKEKANVNPRTLSGGQKQRVALAGILAIGPRVIILDEATSMLDPKGRHDLLKLLKKLIAERDMTVISITHDPVELSLSDYTVVLDHGKVAMQGETTTLLQDPAKLADLHLALPFAQQLQLLLKKRGINVPAQYLDSERMVEWLCQQLNS